MDKKRQTNTETQPIATEQPITELIPTDDVGHPAAPDETVAKVVTGIRTAQAKHGFALVQDIGRLIAFRDAVPESIVTMRVVWNGS